MARLGRRGTKYPQILVVAGTASGISGSLEAEVEMEMGPGNPAPSGRPVTIGSAGRLRPHARRRPRWGAARRDPGPQPALLTEGPQTVPSLT